MMPKFTQLAFALAILIPAAAQAHPKLVSTTPAVNAAVAPPPRIELKFSEKLIAKLSAGSLTMTGIPGRPHPAIAIGGVASKVAPDGKTLVLTPAKPLAVGSYRVDWHAVSTDTHRVTGTYLFSVR